MREVNLREEEAVESGGLGEVQDFTIQGDGHMFGILISGLYSDKPRAIVRELCTNAYDSHIMAGTPEKPFLLQLPTRFDDTFRIRDYGVSMTHEGVMRTYTVLGKSTKGDRNDEVGKWGLGCKSPFAYIDNYNVIAYLDGEKRIYSAYKDKGFPRMTLLMTEPTDEPNGLEVNFPVKQQDHQKFIEAARRVLVGFDYIPENNIGITKVEFKVLFQGPGWRVVEKDYTHSISGAFVRQGCVLYPVDALALRASLLPKSGFELLSSEAIIIDMPIGTVDITPSRESLQYDDTTIKNILNRLEEIKGDVVNELSGAVQNAKSYYEAVRIRNRMIGGLQSTALRNIIMNAMKWKKRPLKSHIQVTGANLQSLRRRNVHLTEIKADHGRRSSKRCYHIIPNSMEFTPNDTDGTMFIYLKDASIKYQGYRLAAARAMFNHQSDYNKLVFLPGFTPGTYQEVLLRVVMGRPEGKLHFVDLESVPFTKPQFTRNKVMLSVYNETNGIWMREELPEDKIPYYFHTHGGTVKHDGRFIRDTKQIVRLWSELRSLDSLPTDAVLVGIPASRKDIAALIDDEWVEFLVEAEKLVADKYDHKLAALSHLAQSLSNDGENSQALRVYRLMVDKLAELHVKDGAMAALAPLVLETVSEDHIKAGRLTRALHDLVIASFTADARDRILKAKEYDIEPLKTVFKLRMKSLKETYPLIDTLITNCRYHLHVNPDADWLGPMIEYVNLKDVSDRNAARLLKKAA